MYIHICIHIYMNIYLFFFRFSPRIGYHRKLSGVACGQYFLDTVRGMTQGSPEWGLLKQSVLLKVWSWTRSSGIVRGSALGTRRLSGASQTTESGTQGGAQDPELEPASSLLTRARVQTHSSENAQGSGRVPPQPWPSARTMLPECFLLTLLWALATGSMYIFPSCLHPTEISPEAFLTFFISPPAVPQPHKPCVSLYCPGFNLHGYFASSFFFYQTFNFVLEYKVFILYLGRAS